MWLPDGSAVLFQREDLRAGSDLYAGQAAVRYPARIEQAAPGGARSVVVADGHHPSPSPDGSELAFVRLSPHGTSLEVHSLIDGSERVLVPPGTLPDITYPRYAPSGDRLAFMATTASSQQPIDGAHRLSIDLADLLGPRPALAHGLPWNLWVVGRDGAGLHQLAPVGADDASVAWSPDGSQLFVYGSTGARLVDASSGETQLLTFLAGFGAIAWLS
jgi:Tol biopolymer transport system component